MELTAFGPSRPARPGRPTLSRVAVGPAAALAAIAIGLGGCGGGGDRAKAEGVVKTYLRAVADGDGEKACDQLTGEAKREALNYVTINLPELNATSCADGISKLAESLGGDETGVLRKAEVERSRVTGDSATVRIKGATQDAELTKVDGRWYISGGVFG